VKAHGNTTKPRRHGGNAARNIQSQRNWARDGRETTSGQSPKKMPMAMDVRDRAELELPENIRRVKKQNNQRLE